MGFRGTPWTSGVWSLPGLYEFWSAWRPVEYMFGSRGDDVLIADPGSMAARIFAGRGSDTIVGSHGRDKIYAGRGNDRIEGGAGNDVINGGRGVDTAVYQGSILDFSISGAGCRTIRVRDTDRSDGDLGSDRLRSVEVLEFGDYTYKVFGDNAALVNVTDQIAGAEAATSFTIDAVDFDGGTPRATDISVTGPGAMALIAAAPHAQGAHDGTRFEVAYDPDGAYAYLAAGETATETATVTVSDGQGNTTVEHFSMIVQGANDPVVIDRDASDLRGAVTEDDAAHLTDSGRLAFTDADLGDVQTVSVALAGVSGDDAGLDPALLVDALGVVVAAGPNRDDGHVDWTFDVDTDEFRFLDEGEALTVAYDLTIDDGAGGAATETVEITVSGRADPTNLFNGFTLIDGSGDNYDNLGYDVASAGDVNGDGIADIVVGVPQADPDGVTSAGQAHVIFGRDTTVDGAFGKVIDIAALDPSQGFTLYGTNAGGFAGGAVSSAGDFNGDGIDDLLIGARGTDTERGNSGAAHIVFGRDTAVAGDFPASVDLTALAAGDGLVLKGIDAADYAGVSVAAAGDVNGDGIDDIMIGAYLADPEGRANAGETYVVFGRDTATDGGFPTEIDLEDLNGSDGFVVNGADAQSRSGLAVSSAGDVNGDGIDDILIGAPFASRGQTNTGEAYVVFGRDTATSGAFAASVDISALDGTDGFALHGDQRSGFAGYAVANAGDINGDGIDDIAVGAYGGDPGGADYAGQSFVVFGRDTASEGDFSASLSLSALDGSDGFVFNGLDDDDRSAFAVASAGDVNGDGIDDLLIGAPQGDGGGAKSGEFYLVFGRDTAREGDFAGAVDLGTLDGTSGYRLNGAAANDLAGFSLSAAGDVNADGIGDILIGAPGAEGSGGVDAAGAAHVLYGGDDLLAAYDAADGATDGSIQLALLGEDLFAL